MKPDGFDVVASLAAVVLAGSGMGLAVSHRRAVSAEPCEVIVPDPNEGMALSEARRLLDSGQALKALERLRGIESRTPASPMIHVLQGKAFFLLGEHAASLRAYRMTLQEDPDYADLKSPKYIGRDLRLSVGESLRQVRAMLGQDPGNPSLKAALSDGLMLERLLAGGCG